MKLRLAVASAAAYLALGAPGSSQEAPASAQATCGSVYCAVINTAKKVHEANCTPGSPSCSFDPLKAAIKAAWETTTTALCPTNIAVCNVLKLAGNWGMPMPYSISNGGGSAGGGGAWGEWDFDANCRFALGLDAQGNLIIPSIPLPAGDPMVRSTTSTEFFYASGGGGVATYKTKGRLPAVLFNLHHQNIARGEKRRWFGVFALTATGVNSAMPAYFSDTGAVVGRATYSKGSDGPNAFNFTYANDCPAVGSNGGDFDFYVNDDTKGCIWYAPNPALGQGGYAVNPVTSIPFANAGTLQTTIAGHPFLKCPLAKSFLANLTKKAIERANVTPAYEVTPDDVQTGGAPPLVEDLDDTDTPEDTGTSTPPPPDPTPTPTPTPSSGPDYDPTVSLGDPAAPEIDWWPDLPTISVDLGSPACPTYSLTLLGWWDQPFVIDSHCPLIEQNRAAIGLIMTAMFAMMAFFIVLRA